MVTLVLPEKPSVVVILDAVVVVVCFSTLLSFSTGLLKLLVTCSSKLCRAYLPIAPSMPPHPANKSVKTALFLSLITCAKVDKMLLIARLEISNIIILYCLKFKIIIARPALCESRYKGTKKCALKRREKQIFSEYFFIPAQIVGFVQDREPSHR